MMRSVVLLTSVILKILYNEMCQYLEDLHDFVNQCFSMHDVIKSNSKGKIDKYIFNVTKYQKFIDMFSDSIMQLLFNETCELLVYY